MIMLENLYRRPRLLWYSLLQGDDFYVMEQDGQFGKEFTHISTNESVHRICLSGLYNCIRYFTPIWATVSTEGRRSYFLSDNTFIKTYNMLMSQL